MPCDTINIASVKLGKVDPPTLKAAMEALGYQPYNWELDGETLRISGAVTSADLTAKVKREVTKQSVLSQAKRFGWSAKELPNGKIEVLKARL